MDPARLRDRLRAVIQQERVPSSPSATAPVPPAGVLPSVPADGATPVSAASPTVDAAARARRLAEALGGVWEGDGHARVCVITRRYAASLVYGQGSVADAATPLAAHASAAALLATGAVHPPAPPFVFFDLETTGLSGGAGTQAFLAGCGWFDSEGGFVIEQYLLPSPTAERAMLARLSATLGTAGTLVTFNGKAYDAPLIESRFHLHGLPWRHDALPHLDVLHPARRFWGQGREEGCSLVTLERRVLGVGRDGDVPGAEIPGRYFGFLRSGDPAPLEAVCEHNRRDLLSLGVLTARLVALLARGHDATDDAWEALALGRAYDAAGRGAAAVEAWRHAAQLTAPGPLPHGCAPLVAAPRGPRTARTARAEARRSEARAAAHAALARAARRARAWDAAAEAWQVVVEESACPAALAREAREALAVHFEHRAPDLGLARRFAEASLEGEERGAWGDAVRHRLARLDRKLLSGRGPLFPSSPSPQPSGPRTSGRRTSS